MKKYFKLATLLIVLCLCFSETNCVQKVDPLTNDYGRREESLKIECKINIENIGKECELYATKHNGKYPKNLDSIIAYDNMKIRPDCYIDTIPVCPFTQEKYEFESTERPDFYSIKCKYHQMTFDSITGLKEAK